MNIKSLDIIHEEHRALGAMLSGLRTLAREIEAGRLQPDFDLLASMIDYIEKVPEIVHHPKENDYLFARLRLRCAEALPLIEHLEGEHRLGEARIDVLRSALASYRQRGAAGFPVFYEAAKTYIDFEKINDTLDVWFDSGTTHWHVLKGSHPDTHATTGRHADLYLEGSDQHRGWFHSSLLTGCAIDGVPPYKALLTHGFTVDAQGRKMSKSLGNGIEPQEVGDTLGVEILRLWLAASDYSSEFSISKEILARVVEVYRRLRNTLRFLLANTADFNAENDLLPPGDWLEIDRYALALTRRLQVQCDADYASFEFHKIIQALQNFCSEDKASFYLDILKDRLYTTGEKSVPRRAAQSALWHIVQTLTRLMAPVLAFTAEEIWAIAGDGRSVMLSSPHVLPAADNEAALVARWQIIRDFKGETTKVLEGLREAGKIGSSLQAEVVIKANGERYEALASLGNDLRFVLVCSKVTLIMNTDDNETSIVAEPTTPTKCARCWHWRSDVGHSTEHPELCGRCTANLFGSGEPRRVA